MTSGFFNNNWFKIAALIVILVVGFNYLSFLKENNDNRIASENKEYIANRKKDCLNIYKTEVDNWNNVRGWRYSEIDDLCYIRYKDPEPKTEQECDKQWPVGDKWEWIFLRENSLCKGGEFENSF